MHNTCIQDVILSLSFLTVRHWKVTHKKARLVHSVILLYFDPEPYTLNDHPIKHHPIKHTLDLILKLLYTKNTTDQLINLLITP